MLFTLSNYTLINKFNNFKFAIRWLIKLAYNMKRYNISKIFKEFFKIIKILFDKKIIK